MAGLSGAFFLHIAEIGRQAGARLVATENNRRHFTSLLGHGMPSCRKKCLAPPHPRRELRPAS